MDGADEQMADSVDAEDLFGDEGTGEDAGHLQGDQGHHRDEAVAQDMAHQDPLFLEALGSSRPDIVLREVVQHRRSGEPTEGRRVEH